MDLRQLFSKIVLCLFYIVVSGGLINLNKYIVDDRRFPHPMVLTCLHMFMSSVLCFLFYAIKPSMYPGVDRTKGKRWDVFKLMVPIGCCFAVMLYGSNRAYLYCGVAFLQFMKESNVVLVFIFSCIAGLQSMNRQRLVVIAWIILGSCLCVSGDMHFAILGFLFQGSSQLAECIRAVLAEMALTGPQFKLDPLTYTMYMAPICFTVLVIGSIFTWTPDVLTDFKAFWPIIIPNTCLAFLLNVIVALVITETSAVGFIIAGIVKDIALVVFSYFYFHDDITGKQWLSFVVTLTGVFFWSFMKVAPDHPLVLLFERMLCVHRVPCKGVDLESTPLVMDAKKI